MLRVLSVYLSVVLVGVFLLNMVELLPFLMRSYLVLGMIILINLWKCSPSRLVSLGRGFWLYLQQHLLYMCKPVEILVYFFLF